MRAFSTAIILFSETSLVVAKNVVSFSFHSIKPRQVEVGFSKRDGTLTVSLENLQNEYAVTLEVGTPPQNVTVAVDTGSSDLWFIGPDNPYCEGNSGVASSEQVACTDGTIFNPDDSSTWNQNNTDFAISYADGTGAYGYYGQDTISIGGSTIKNANIAVSNNATSTDSVFGIGPRYQEASITEFNSDGTADTYVSVPYQMKSQGLISAVAYSLFLNDMDASEGTILFGGIDKSKYDGDLGLVPVLYSYIRDQKLEEPLTLSVMLNSLGIEDGAGGEQTLVECSVPVVLDSGTTLATLPLSFLTPLAASLEAEWSNDFEAYIAYCNVAGSLTLDFSGVQVNVSLSNLMIPLVESDGSVATDGNGNEICMFGITAQGNDLDLSETYLFGDTILRGLYVVYDLENWEVGIANANYDGGDSDIEEISTDGLSGSSAASYDATTASSDYSTATSLSVYASNEGQLASSVTAESLSAKVPASSARTQHSNSNASGSPKSTSPSGAGSSATASSPSSSKSASSSPASSSSNGCDTIGAQLGLFAGLMLLL